MSSDNTINNVPGAVLSLLPSPRSIPTPEQSWSLSDSMAEPCRIGPSLLSRIGKRASGYLSPSHPFASSRWTTRGEDGVARDAHEEPGLTELERMARERECDEFISHCPTTSAMSDGGDNAASDEHNEEEAGADDDSLSRTKQARLREYVYQASSIMDEDDDVHHDLKYTPESDRPHTPTNYHVKTSSRGFEDIDYLRLPPSDSLESEATVTPEEYKDDVGLECGSFEDLPLSQASPYIKHEIRVGPTWEGKCFGCLLPLNSDKQIIKLPRTSRRITIGKRRDCCDIVLGTNRPWIGNKQCTFSWNMREDGYSEVILMNHSSNGTFVGRNNKIKRIRRDQYRKLKDGDIIGFGMPTNLNIDDLDSLDEDFRYIFYHTASRMQTEKDFEPRINKKLRRCRSLDSLY